MTTPVVDGLSFVGPALFGAGRTIDGVVGEMDAHGVDLNVVVANRPPAYELGAANEWLAGEVGLSGGRLLGLARVDPNQTSAATQVERAFGELDLRGLFLHPREEVFVIDDPKLDVVVDLCATYGRPVVVAAGYPWVSEALQVGELARRHPEVPIVMTNGGQFNISGLGQLDTELALDAQPNLMIQTSGVYRQDFIERAIERFGARRVIFASASPVFDLAYELLRVEHAEIAAEADRALVLGANSLALFAPNR